MTHAPARSPVLLTASSPASAPEDTESPDVGWTPERQALFLRALAATHSVSQAARRVGLSRQSAYQLRARMKGEPFDLAWAAALDCRFDALAECALERAMHGIEVPHFYKGEMIGTSRKFDERLTVALLAMRDRLAPPPRLPASAARDVTPDFEGLIGVLESGAQSWDEAARNEAAARIEEGDDPCARWGVKVEGEEEGEEKPENTDWLGNGGEQAPAA